MYKGLLRPEMIKHHSVSKVTKGKLFVIRPKHKLDIGKTEKDPNKLERVYQEGRSMALEILPNLISYLS